MESAKGHEAKPGNNYEWVYLALVTLLSYLRKMIRNTPMISFSNAHWYECFVKPSNLDECTSFNIWSDEHLKQKYIQIIRLIQNPNTSDSEIQNMINTIKCEFSATIFKHLLELRRQISTIFNSIELSTQHCNEIHKIYKSIRIDPNMEDLFAKANPIGTQLSPYIRPKYSAKVLNNFGNDVRLLDIYMIYTAQQAYDYGLTQKPVENALEKKLETTPVCNFSQLEKQYQDGQVNIFYSFSLITTKYLELLTTIGKNLNIQT